MKFLVINGPNLNLTQFTEPGMEGRSISIHCWIISRRAVPRWMFRWTFFQSNHEGDLIDEIQSAAGRADGIILNPGATPITAWPFWKRCRCAACPPWK